MADCETESLNSVVSPSGLSKQLLINSLSKFIDSLIDKLIDSLIGLSALIRPSFVTNFWLTNRKTFGSLYNSFRLSRRKDETLEWKSLRRGP